MCSIDTVHQRLKLFFQVFITASPLPPNLLFFMPFSCSYLQHHYITYGVLISTSYLLTKLTVECCESKPTE